MKKKILLLLIIIMTLTFTTGCLENDNLEGSNITTTVYPVEYLVTRLYETKNIKSIYPNGTKINEYELTEKQIKDYSRETNLFVYTGLSEEKEIAKTFINKNKKIQLIDASYSLKYTYGLEELWMNPNNYLMLANTIKTNLQELSSSKYAANKIEENYQLLEEDLSSLDAEIRSISKAAQKNNTNTIVIAYDSFGFLDKYGFNIVNISNENNITSTIKNKFKNKSYKYILVKDKKNVSDSVKDLVDNYDAELIEVDTMDTLTDSQKSNGDNYLTIMREFINTISKITLT
jgi:zinc transport system substrate-binding protein